MRTYSSNKDLARFIAKLVKDGWSFRHGGKHNRLISPQGRLVVTPISPGDRRALLNVKRTVRQVESSQA